MRAIILLFCTTVFSFSPTHIFSQNTKVKIDRDKIVTIDEVFDIIREQTDFSFLYDAGLFKDAPKVYLKKGKMDANQLLNDVIQQRNFKLNVLDSNTVVIRKSEHKATVQRHEIKGTVVDASGVPLAGTSIIVKGTTTGTQTDFDGNYSLQVPNQNTILVFSYVGFVTQEITVGSQTTVNITMKEDASKLEEVVVVAYGTQKKESVTSSIATVKSDDLTDLTEPNPSAMLQGKVAGVQISASQGTPGSAPEVLIRGMASLNGSVTPLWVVDGVIQHGTPIVNPNDIESMSVLKDASATSLYGSRGANGVIIVTTKQAKLGVSKLTFTSRIGVNHFNSGKFEVMDSKQLYDYHTLMGNTQDWFTPDLLDRNFNWIDNATKAGFVQDYTMSYTTSTDKIRTYIAGGYYNEEGTIKGSDFKRYTFRLNLDYKVSKRLTLKPKVSFSFDDRFNAEHSRYNMYTNLPWDIPFDAEGNPIKAQESSDWIGRDKSNYYYDLQWNYGKSKIFNMSFNGDFEFKILDNLTYHSTNNFTLYHYNGMTYVDPLSVAGTAVKGSVENSTARRFTRLTTQMLRYTKDFGENSITALAGYEYNDYVYENTGATGVGIISGGEILNVTAEPKAIEGGKNEYALQSMFFNVDYAYSNRYFAKASIRRDGASNFGIDKQYGTFFALGAGWNISNEAFFNSKNINLLKFRVSYGSVGNRPKELYPYQDTYSMSQYDAIPSADPYQYGNPDLSWEKSYETNLAIDARFFNRINTTLEYYNKNTSDLLYRVDLPEVTGFDGYWENVGGLKNSGFEVVLDADIIQTDNFNWNLGFNIGINKNEITELFDGQTEIQRGNKIFKVGEDMSSWYMRKWIGVNPDDGKPLWEVVDATTGEISQTSNYNEATQQLVGNASPDFIGGFNSRLAYKGFSLDARFSFVSGGEIYNSSRELYDSDGLYPTFNQQVLIDGWSRWEKPGDEATHPQAIYGGNNNSNKPSSRFLEDRSYLKLKNITLGYELPNSITEKLSVSNARIYISGDNLLTFTKYSGTDPEVGGNPDDGALNGIIRTAYPIPQRFVLGLNFSF
ncbi:MAG: SusC/RagA family TonB-linked outer membrane protein [Aestuariibaculum sp.]